MTFTHIVSFKFKQGMSPEVVKVFKPRIYAFFKGEMRVVSQLIPLQSQELVDRMYALKATCLHPTTGEPYILSAAGGRDNSVQGLQVRSHSPHILQAEQVSKANVEIFPLFRTGSRMSLLLGLKIKRTGIIMRCWTQFILTLCSGATPWLMTFLLLISWVEILEDILSRVFLGFQEYTTRLIFHC